jgi:hypothetical protein
MRVFTSSLACRAATEPASVRPLSSKNHTGPHQKRRRRVSRAGVERAATPAQPSQAPGRYCCRPQPTEIGPSLPAVRSDRDPHIRAIRPTTARSASARTIAPAPPGNRTAIIAAGMSGRACHAIELSPAYVNLAVCTGRRSPQRRVQPVAQPVAERRDAEGRHHDHRRRREQDPGRARQVFAAVADHGA